MRRPSLTWPPGAESGLFDLFINTSASGEYSGQYQFNLSDEQDLSGHAGQQTLTVNVTADVVPEPRTLALLAGGTHPPALPMAKAEAGQSVVTICGRPHPAPCRGNDCLATTAASRKCAKRIRPPAQGRRSGRSRWPLCSGQTSLYRDRPGSGVRRRGAGLSSLMRHAYDNLSSLTLWASIISVRLWYIIGVSGTTQSPDRYDPARIIRAPRGTQISAKSWLTEAALRMLMNNLDPDVAERPAALVVYGGIGRGTKLEVL